MRCATRLRRRTRPLALGWLVACGPSTTSTDLAAIAAIAATIPIAPTRTAAPTVAASNTSSLTAPIAAAAAAGAAASPAATPARSRAVWPSLPGCNVRSASTLHQLRDTRPAGMRLRGVLLRLAAALTSQHSALATALTAARPTAALAATRGTAASAATLATTLAPAAASATLAATIEATVVSPALAALALSSTT